MKVSNKYRSLEIPGVTIRWDIVAGILFMCVVLSLIALANG